MLPDKEIKKWFKKQAQQNPEKYYPFKALKGFGFRRKECTSCGTFFWTKTGRVTCDDPQCVGTLRFLDNPPTKIKLSYIKVWKTFSKMFRKMGYTPISRYPVVARWNPTMEYTIASIAAFQPYVVSGEVEPPANPLVIPQFCLRFTDADNVGITGHMVGFTMIGQHGFVPAKDYDMDLYLSQIYEWLVKGLKIPDTEITFHEDAWAGGGNYGSCIEFFVGGLELGNQVYMQYQYTESGPKELPIKVLDMGMGQERNAWITQGKTSIYDVVFPKVMKHLYRATGLQPDKKLMKKFVAEACRLNVDEVNDIEKAWGIVAKKIGMDVDQLKAAVVPLAHLYAIAEHMRAVLFVLHDGGLPSNVGGGYNLRLLIRRSLSFIDKHKWNIHLADVCAWHAKELKVLYPELSEHLDDIQKILDIEKIKYENTRQKATKIIAGLKKIDEKELLQLYDSHGISPDMIPGVTIPKDFYAKTAALHEKKVHVAATVKEEKVPLPNIPETKALYYDDYKRTEFDAKVLKIIGNIVVLDQTAFYPTSGGQLHDLGTLNGCAVEEVWKQGSIIVHRLNTVSFKESAIVKGTIDRARRIQMAQHHTSAHIINAAARRVLGRHVNQAGALKEPEKARIDLTHYDIPSEKEIAAIEKEANTIIAEAIPIEKKFYTRNDAEKLFGTSIYQGGVPPGKMLRIVNITGVDVEACGGTHLNNTKEAEVIKILKATKVQDGVIRLVYVAGNAAKTVKKDESVILEELQSLLECRKEEIPGRVRELFELWKNVVKKHRTIRRELVSKEWYEGEDILGETARILKTQQEHVIKTVHRFLDELKAR